MWRRVPRRPTAIEAAAITAGPVRNLTAIANVATEFPHAIILGWRAIKRPISNQIIKNSILISSLLLLCFFFLFSNLTKNQHYDKFLSQVSSYSIPIY